MQCKATRLANGGAEEGGADHSGWKCSCVGESGAKRGLLALQVGMLKQGVEIEDETVETVG